MYGCGGLNFPVRKFDYVGFDAPSQPELLLPDINWLRSQASNIRCLCAAALARCQIGVD